MPLFQQGFRPTKTIILNDSNGVDSVKIKNSHGFVVAEINSKGDIIKKGRDIKT